MATTQVSAAMIRKYYNHPSVCDGWKDSLREEFNLHTGTEVFEVHHAFIKDMYDESSDDVRSEMLSDFPSVFAENDGATGIHLAQSFPLAAVAVMTGIEVAGNSAKNSKLPEAVGKGIFLDGNYEFLIRKTKKGNYLIVPIAKTESNAPAKFTKLSNLF